MKQPTFDVFFLDFTDIEVTGLFIVHTGTGLVLELDVVYEDTVHIQPRVYEVLDILRRYQLLAKLITGNVKYVIEAVLCVCNDHVSLLTLSHPCHHKINFCKEKVE